MLEAMKMENSIVSDYAGTVKQILVKNRRQRTDRRRADRGGVTGFETPSNKERIFRGFSLNSLSLVCAVETPARPTLASALDFRIFG